MTITLILLVGLEPSSMTRRSLALQSAGYIVVSAYSIKDAINRFLGGDFDLVQICQSVPVGDRDRLIAWIRAFGSRLPIVSVSRQLDHCDPLAGAMIFGEKADPVRITRDALIKPAVRAVRSTISCARKEMIDSRVENGLAPGTSFRSQIENINEQSATLVSTG